MKLIPFDPQKHLEKYLDYCYSQDTMIAFDYKPPEDRSKFVNSILSNKWTILWVVDEKEDEIGWITFYDIDKIKSEAKVDYLIFRENRGKGYAKQLQQLRVDYAKSMGLNKLIAYVVESNEISEHVLKSSGFKYLGIEFDEDWPHYPRPQKWRMYELNL